MISTERIERLDQMYSNDFKGFADAMIREWKGIRDALRARSELSEGTIEAAALRARAEMPDEISDRAKAIRSRGGAFHHETADMLDSLSRRAAELEAENAKLLERCATVCENMRPSGSRPWTHPQRTSHNVLSKAAQNIRALGAEHD